MTITFQRKEFSRGQKIKGVQKQEEKNDTLYKILKVSFEKLTIRNKSRNIRKGGKM